MSFFRISVAAAFVALAGVIGLVATSNAGDKTTFEPAAFSQAQTDQKHIVVEVFKKGCGTCAAQKPSLEAARAQYPDAVFMAFDFANDAEFVKRFEVVKQSTIIVFKGKDEVARLVGETQRDAILGAIAKGA